MKTYIEYNFQKNAWGGGNQFLKALKNEFKKLKIYSENPEESNIIIFNSHQNLDEVKKLKAKLPKNIFIHRVDGPMRLYNNMSDKRDSIVNNINKQIANGTIFQSNYSFLENIKLGMKKPNNYVIIGNFCDPDIFKPKPTIGTNEKTRLISTSFSKNIKKGFKYYSFLDKHLDFNKYEYVFAGHSPIKFTNIKMLGCLNSQQLAAELFNSDIYVTASKNDPCSNSLIEAKTVGLPTIVLESGGHPEIINKNSETFLDNNDLINKIELVSENLVDYFSNRTNEKPSDIVNKYIKFFEKLL